MPFSNQLINETSPYLLQHAHNPVNWYPWGEEALKKAKEEDKPILLSIGYSACHWCHVMERESFEDEATAKLMNENFINIKIDREERPDLDHIYMDAVQAMTGSGGWPLNVFLTPEARPFYGGTYFPPQRAFNRPSWQETLLGVKQAFQERRHEMDAQAENLTEHLLKSNSFGFEKAGDSIFSESNTTEIFQKLMESADKVWGGFGKAPKFPQTFSILYLLRYGHLMENQEAIGHALLSLDKMIEGGIYDQLGGGFARYSTDAEWLAPHFEKMLYDNALLVSVLCEAFQLTGKLRYKEVIMETMEFVQRELMAEQVTNLDGKGFYAALDADSEGVEGKFYVWSLPEIEELLGNDADIFCRYYDVSSKGNWEEKNIFRVKQTAEQFAATNNISIGELKELLERSRKVLLTAREKRIRPSLDDKIILGWNALMNTACSKAFAATGNDAYRQLAIDNMNFLLANFSKKDGKTFHHTWKNNKARYPAFLDDLAFLIQALIQLQEITSDKKWLEKAKEIMSMVIDDFSEEETGFFYFTGSSQEDVILRKKEVYDSAVASGNSVMASNLYQLSILFDLPEWKERSVAMVRSLGIAISRYPGSFGNWACQLLEIVTGTSEIAVIGSGYPALVKEILGFYIPQRVIMGAEKADPVFPLLADKPLGEKNAIFLCRNYTCQAPVFSAKELITLINRVKRAN